MLGALQGREAVSGAVRRQWYRLEPCHVGEAGGKRQDLEASAQLQTGPHMLGLVPLTDGSPSGWISASVLLNMGVPGAVGARGQDAQLKGRVALMTVSPSRPNSGVGQQSCSYTNPACQCPVSGRPGSVEEDSSPVTWSVAPGRS